MKKVVIIGSGFAGLSAASFMAKAGWDVTVMEKHAIPGGRARNFTAQGFTFDMGPSWYWMPDVFERFFSCFGKKVSDYYELKRLDPSYRIYYEDGPLDIPAGYEQLKAVFDKIEAGSSLQLDRFLKEAAYKYETGIKNLVFKPGRSLSEFIDASFLRGILKLDVFTSMKKHVARFFHHPKLIQLMEFPVLFLGALPENIPALYSLMNYADIKLGTWYPKGGMYQIVDGMYKLAKELGVKFKFEVDVVNINIENGTAVSVTGHDLSKTAGTEISLPADVVIAAADYHFVETVLLPEKYRSYSASYWQTRTMAPSCLIYYVGLNKKLRNIQHHTLFFDVDFERHGREIYQEPGWPKEPLFYVSATSVTDDGVAPTGCENLFFLVPVATNLTGDTEALREQYFEKIVTRYESHTKQQITDAIIYKRSYAVSDFVLDYNAFKGNAYGLANTLKQTSLFKPSIKSRKLQNLFYAGQLTVPGPGVPPSLISGEVAAKEVIKEFG